jgi:hypothetical protein
MVPTQPTGSRGGLFKSPFPTDAAPPSPAPAEPRARPSGGDSGGAGGAGANNRSQRPDLEVDWSHLDRERAAIAANKSRNEGDRRGSSNRYGGPLIGANEIGTGQLSERDERDDRHNRDDRRARDRDAYRDEDAGGANEYGDDGGDGRRSRRRGYEGERDRQGGDRGVDRDRNGGDRRDDRDRYDAGRGDDRASDRPRREHGARAGHAPSRRYDDGYDQGDDGRYDDHYDARDRGGDAGYDERYDDRHHDRYDDPRDRRDGRQNRADRHTRRSTPRDDYDEPWNDPGPAALGREAPQVNGEQGWGSGGGLWGDAAAEGDSAYYPAPAASPTKGKPGKTGKSGGGKKPGMKRVFRVAWTVGSIVSSLAVFLLVRFEMQRGSGIPGAPTVAVNSAQNFTDSLLTNKNGWLTNTNCIFKPDGYHLTRGYLAYAPVADAVNFDMWVQVKQTGGTLLAPYGLVFRRVSLGNYYVFGIDGNGKWTFYKTVENVTTDIVSYTASPAIKQGLNAQNTLEVKAHGTHFAFFVNGTQIGQADDTSLATKGSLGVAGHDDIEVVFTAFSLIRLA